MKTIGTLLTLVALLWACSKSNVDETAQASMLPKTNQNRLYLDVHNLEPGKVTFDAVAEAHQKDLATQDKYDVSFIKYWVDEAQGKVYCLVQAPDSAAVYLTHQEAHGLTPDLVSQVSDGVEAAIANADNLFLDVHELGAGK